MEKSFVQNLHKSVFFYSVQIQSHEKMRLSYHVFSILFNQFFSIIHLAAECKVKSKQFFTYTYFMHPNKM